MKNVFVVRLAYLLNLEIFFDEVMLKVVWVWSSMIVHIIGLCKLMQNTVL